MSDEDGPRTWHSGDANRSPVLFVLLLVLALAATGLLVFTDTARWLRLGALAALWAALIGSFIAVRYRKQLGEREAEVAEQHALYELELEREAAARAEYELAVEDEVRGRAPGETGEAIAALQEEVRGLRETLEALLGGEVLVERIALNAESMRMRSVPDTARRQAAVEQPAHGMPLGPGAEPRQRKTADPSAATAYFPGGLRQAAGPEPRRAEREASQAQRPARPQPTPAQPASQPPAWPRTPTRESPEPAAQVPGKHAAADAATGGRQRAEQPTWLGEWQPTAAPAGNGAATERQSEPSNGNDNGRRAARNGTHAAFPTGQKAQEEDPDKQPSGSHATGTSVAELLAAHGGDAGRRGRRRAE